MCTAKDEKGLANIREVLVKFTSTSDEGKEVASLLRAEHTTWRQRWHCIDNMPELAGSDSAIAQRLQDGLLDANVGPRELADMTPSCTLEEFVTSLDSLLIAEACEVPSEFLQNNRVAVSGPVSHVVLNRCSHLLCLLSLHCESF